MTKPTCAFCPTKADGICCTSHNTYLCHRCYRRYHFVEVCSLGCMACEREGLNPTRPVDVTA